MVARPCGKRMRQRPRGDRERSALNRRNEEEPGKAAGSVNKREREIEREREEREKTATI